MLDQDTQTAAKRYAAHIEQKLTRFHGILEQTDYQALLIASGGFKTQFQDDLSYPFKAHPYFREWLPLSKRRDAFLLIELGHHKPTLFLNTAEDIWHTAPQTLPEGFEAPFNTVRNRRNRGQMKV